jgi:hypothetical protein
MSGTITRIGATGAGALLAVGLFAAPPAGANGSGGHGQDHRSAACFTATDHTQGRSHSDPDGTSNGGADKPGCTGGVDANRDGNNGCGNDTDREDDNNGHCGQQTAQQADDHDDASQAGDTNAEAEAARAGKTRCQGHDRATTTTTPTTATPTTATTAATAPGATTVVLGAGSARSCSCAKDSTATVGAANVKLQAAGAVPAAASLVAAPSSTTTTTTTTTAAALPATVSAAGSASPAAVEATTATTAPGTQVLGETLSRPSALARTGAGVGALAILGGLLLGGGRLTVLARRLLRIG